MRVLGSQILEDFCRRRPRARGALTALHAVLSETDAASQEALRKSLGALVVRKDGNALVLHLADAGAEIVLSFNPAAEVVKINAVRPLSNGKDRS